MIAKRSYWPGLLFLLLVWVGITAVSAQETALQLRLNRDFGAGLGNDIQGRFSMIVEAPTEVERVAFLIDNEIISEQTTAPFRYQFQTENYAAGPHTLSAIGYTSDGRELSSNQITRNFITSDESSQRLIYFIIPLILLIFGGRVLTSWIANRGQKDKKEFSIHGSQGGTICPNCHKPYARHWWAPNLVTGKFDRCPHCGRWRFVQRVHPDILQASYEAMMQAEQTKVDDEKANTPTTGDDLQKRLDDSRFDS